MLKSNSREASLAEELPYWEFQDLPFPHILLTDGSISAGLRVGQIDIECFDASEVNQLTENLRSLMNSVSEGIKMQWVLSIGSDFSDLISTHEKGVNPSSNVLLLELEKSRTAKLRNEMKDGSLYRPKLSIYLNLLPPSVKKPGLFSSQKEFQHVSHLQMSEAQTELKENLDSLVSSLAGFGLDSRLLTREEMIEGVYQALNPKRSRTEPVPKLRLTQAEDQLPEEVLENSPWFALSSPRGEIVFGDLVMNLDRFTLDSTLHAAVTLKTLPEATYAGMISGLLRLPFHYDLILTVDVPAQAKEMSKLQAKRRMAHSMSVTHGNHAADLENESKLNSTEELIRELLNTGQKIFASDLVIVLRAPHGKDGERELNRQIREVLSRIRMMNGAEGIAESVANWKVFKNTLPGAPKELVRARRIKTNNLVDFLPVYGPRVGDENPKVMLSNRLGGLVGYDSFSSSLGNYNALVTGSSGAGKSFLNNCILTQELARGTRAFIIDIGGSYKKLTHALGGQYVEVNLSQEYSINPFHIEDPTQEPSSQKIKSLLSVVELMIAEDDTSKLPKLDRVLLEQSIIETYAKCRAENRVPRLSDLSKTCSASKEPVLKNIAKMLFSWTGDRPYGVLLDQEGSLKTSGSICAFDLKGLSNWPDLQGVMILILTEFILSAIERDRSTTNRIILDEAWELLKSPAAARFMEFCVRTLRKMGGGSGITFITQGVEEIVSSPIGAAILNNTATKFVMLQRGNSKALQAALKLNAQELALIHSLEQRKGVFSEGFLIEGNHRQVVRIEPQPLEYWLSTSDAKDNLALDQIMAKENVDLPTAIRLAAKSHPFGISHVSQESKLCA
jgi:type IV secretory pathway VirB4 component